MRRICLLARLPAFIATSDLLPGAPVADGQDRLELVIGSGLGLAHGAARDAGSRRQRAHGGLHRHARLHARGPHAIQMIRTADSLRRGAGLVGGALQGGYEATFGRYDLDETYALMFTYHVEGSLVRDLVGKDLPRVYELNGSRLTIKVPPTLRALARNMGTLLRLRSPRLSQQAATIQQGRDSAGDESTCCQAIDGRH